MKKIILIVLSVVGFTLTSCEDFLNTKTEGYKTSFNYFSNDIQLDDAIAALYCRQMDMFNTHLFYEQMGANDIVLGMPHKEYDESLALLDATGNESNLMTAYTLCFEWVASSQWVIQRLEEIKAAKEAEGSQLSALEQRSLGEAYFLRAFWHFYAAYRYGTGEQGVPYKPWEEYENGYNAEMPPMLPSVVDNYLYIVSDLKKAEELLPWDGEVATTYKYLTDHGRVHKLAACAFYTKVYAYMGTWKEECAKRDIDPWQEVINGVEKLESGYGRDLHPSFSELWAPEFDKFWNKEACYSIPSGKTGPISFASVVLEKGGWGQCESGVGRFKPTLEIYNEMLKDGVGNERLTRSILTVGDKFPFWGNTRDFTQIEGLPVGFQINKYMAAFAVEGTEEVGVGYVNPKTGYTNVNFHIIRFADCLLLRAEAYMNQGKYDLAAADINRIRQRSNLAPLPGNATWEDLYHERRCELAFEPADHLYDLKRWAHSSYGVAEIAALAKAEFERKPTVRSYSDRSDPACKIYKDTVYVQFTEPRKAWTDNRVAFKYPETEIQASNGAYTQIQY